jgi:multiple sugar transport system substrate-binding protein
MEAAVKNEQLMQMFVSPLRAWGLLVVAAIIAGCGAAPAAAPAPTAAPATAAPPPTVAAAAPTTAPSPSPTPAELTYAFPDDAASVAAATTLIKAYTSAHPEIEITAKPLPAGDYAQQLLVTLETGAPDIFASADTQAPALINRDAVLDLQELLVGQGALAPSDFQPAALAAWQRGDSIYGLPADVVPQVLFYNQDLFAAGNVATPAPGWTWDDWLASAKQLTVRSGGSVSRYGTALTQWSAMVWGNGGELISADGTQTLLDSPAAAEGVQFAADMINVHQVAPLPRDAGGPNPVELFQSQGVAMMPGPSSLAASLLAAKLPFKWAIAPLPVGKVAVSPLSVSGLAISSRSESQQAALDFAAFIVGPEGSALKAGLLPFAAPALRAAAPRAADVTGEEAILKALDHGRTLPQVEAWPEIKALVDKALLPVWQGKQPAAAVYRQVASDINALLKVG